MTIEEARKKKHKLERKLFELINEFERETDLELYEVNLKRVSGIGKTRVAFVFVEVNLD